PTPRPLVLGVDFSGAGPIDLPDLPHVRAFRKPGAGLFDDAERLRNFLTANHVAIVAVAVLSDRNVELELTVEAVGMVLANVERRTARPERRSGHAQFDRLVDRQLADADGPVHENRIVGQKLVVLFKPRFHPVAESLHAADPAF